MRDIDAPSSYSQGNEAEFRSEINKDMNAAYKMRQDVFIEATQRLCLQSADGSWWRMEVDNAGLPVFTGVTP